MFKNRYRWSSILVATAIIILGFQNCGQGFDSNQLSSNLNESGEFVLQTSGLSHSSAVPVPIITSSGVNQANQEVILRFEVGSIVDKVNIESNGAYITTVNLDQVAGRHTWRMPFSQFNDNTNDIRIRAIIGDSYSGAGNTVTLTLDPDEAAPETDSRPGTGHPFLAVCRSRGSCTQGKYTILRDGNRVNLVYVFNNGKFCVYDNRNEPAGDKSMEYGFFVNAQRNDFLKIDDSGGRYCENRQ